MIITGRAKSRTKGKTYEYKHRELQDTYIFDIYAPKPKAGLGRRKKPPSSGAKVGSR